MENIESIKQQIHALQTTLFSILQGKPTILEAPLSFNDNLNILLHSVNTRKAQVATNDYSKSCIVAKFIDKDMIPPLQSIFDMLKDLNNRVQALENK